MIFRTPVKAATKAVLPSADRMTSSAMPEVSKLLMRVGLMKWHLGVSL